jgi:hypothetical protein
MSTPEWNEGSNRIAQAQERAKLDEEERERAAWIALTRPVTRLHVLLYALAGFASGTLGFTPCEQQAAWAKAVSQWRQLAGILIAFCGPCATAGHWLGLKRSWNLGQAQSASYKIAAWAVGLPLGLVLISKCVSNLSDNISSTPGWALAIIVLLVLILFKRWRRLMRTMIVLAVLSMTRTLQAQPIPWGTASEVGASLPSTLTLDCTRRDWTSKEVKANCTFAKTYVTKPEREDMKKAVDTIRATVIAAMERSPESAEKAWKDACFIDKKKLETQAQKLAALEPVQRKFIKLLVEACEARSVPKLLEWYDFTWGVEAETCTIRTLITKTVEFTMKDENHGRALKATTLAMEAERS